MDDVVMSVDQDHRREIARLIAEEFAEDYQTIITTHDKLWAQQLESEGALDGGNQVWLQEWSLDAGITESEYRIDVGDKWDKVEAAMSNDNMQRAAHELRYATEKMLQQTCTSLGAQIEYRTNNQYTLSDFKDAVCRRLNKLTGKAKSNLTRHTDTEDFEAADELDNRYGELLSSVGDNLDRINRRVHWTPGKWLTLGPKEFKEVYDMHKKAMISYTAVNVDRQSGTKRWVTTTNSDVTAETTTTLHGTKTEYGLLLRSLTISQLMYY
jgi:hypothetical protein